MQSRVFGLTMYAARQKVSPQRSDKEKEPITKADRLYHIPNYGEDI